MPHPSSKIRDIDGERLAGCCAGIVSASLLASLLMTAGCGQPARIVEDFDRPGKPRTAPGMHWSFNDQMRPVSGWEEIVPGDGFAYLTIDADRGNDKQREQQSWPFQTIAISPVRPGHRLEMRARNTVIPGVASFIFTYSEEGGLVDEIDIEIVGDDTRAPPDGHPTGIDGWTDARFNAWADADPVSLKPQVVHKQPVVDGRGRKRSHQDGEFHIYTIEWRVDRIDFLIDGVHQQTITDVVPDSRSDLIIGLRHMKWTGKLDWPGTQTMVVDWVRIEGLFD